HLQALRRDFPVTIPRSGRLAGVALVASLALVTLAACGSDDNTSPGTSGAASDGKISCASGSIKSSGSSAQKNAMTQWISTYQQSCPGATVDYSPSGSGAGVEDFIND